MSRVMAALALMVGLVVGTSPATAQSEGGGGASSSPPVGDPEVAALVQQAEDEGPVRVIVALDGVEEPASADGVLQADEAQSIDQVQDEAVAVADAAGEAEVVYEHETVPGVVLDVDADALVALADSPNVVAITEDVPESTNLETSTPVVGAPDAWAAGYDGSGGNVAVLDSGTDKGHPALAGAVVAEACFSQTETPLTSSCPNGGPTQIGSGSALPCLDTGCDHGTHVAATVAAGTSAGGAGDGVGAAPGAGIISVKVFGENSSGSTQAFISDQEVALDWLFQNRVALDLVAVNMSLGGGAYPSEAACDLSNPTRAALIGQLRNAGVPVVISSGNDGLTSQMGRPGCFSTSISVGATNDADVVASFSNNTSFLDLLAPGVDVCAPVPGGGDGCGEGLGGTFDFKDGTSMAAPHVAAAFAILAEQHPGTGSEAMLDRLEATGVPVTDTRVGAGSNVTPRVQVDEALTAFDDVDFAHPFLAEIEWMADVGVSNGYPDGTYRPSIAVSRQAMSAFMFRLAGEPAFSPPGSPSFSDVPQSAPFFDEIEWMADESITNGYPDGTYRPSIAVSRQAMSAFMLRLSDGPGVGI